MKKDQSQAKVAILDKTNKMWFEPHEIRNLLVSTLNRYPGEFEVKLW